MGEKTSKFHELMHFLRLFYFGCLYINDQNHMYSTILILFIKVVPSSSTTPSSDASPRSISFVSISCQISPTLNHLGMFSLNLMEYLNPGNLVKEKKK